MTEKINIYELAVELSDQVQRLVLALEVADGLLGDYRQDHDNGIARACVCHLCTPTTAYFAERGKGKP